MAKRGKWNYERHRAKNLVVENIHELEVIANEFNEINPKTLAYHLLDKWEVNYPPSTEVQRQISDLWPVT